MKRAVIPVLLLLALAPAARGEWLPGTVTLSDGTSIRGDVYVTNDRILLQNEALGKRYTVRTAEMARLENTVEKQSMEEKWLFKESGSDEKVFLGQYYPVREYATTVTFQDGKTLKGHLIAATLYVRTDDGRRRFILRRKEDGKVGQKLSDLVFVQSVAFGKGTGVLGTISGRLKVPPGERLAKVLALNRDKLFSVEGKFAPADGRFSVPRCTEGAYDAVVVTDKAVYLDFGLEREKGSKRLDTEAVKGVQSWVNGLRDFFTTQTVMYAAGNAKRTLALVRQECHAGTTLQGLAVLYRYEVWAMSKPKDEWVIDKRFFVWRSPSEDANAKPLRVVVAPALGGLAVSAKSPDVKLDLELPVKGEDPIPPHKPPKEEADVDAAPAK